MTDLNARLQARSRTAEALNRALAVNRGLVPPRSRPNCVHAYFRYSPSYSEAAWEGLSRHLFVEALAAEGVLVEEGPIHRPLSARLQQSPGRRSQPVAARRCAAEEIVIALPDGDTVEIAEWAGNVQSAIEKVWDQKTHLAQLAARQGEVLI
jgi:dTDP-4-amino-4,6-dideoxygalactose transaminase